MNERSNLGRITYTFKWGLDVLVIAIFVAMSLLPLFETIARIFGFLSIPASQVLVQHSTLWIGFLGAVLAARQNKLLALSQKQLFKRDKNFHFGRWIAKVVTFAVLIALAWASWKLVIVEMKYPIDIAPNIPRWVAQIIMPLGFIFIAIYVYLNSYSKQGYRFTLILVTLILSIPMITDMGLMYSSLPISSKALETFITWFKAQE